MSDYPSARRVLLDALEALGDQRAAVVLCGAQAVYVRTGEGDFNVAPATFDADLMLSPSDILKQPLIREVMQAAHFKLTEQPGIWMSREGIEVDLLVAESLGGSGRRGARLGVQGDTIARKVRGLEAAVVENSIERVHSLDAVDKRTFDIAVAGTAALVVAKVHKIHERADGPASRLKNKDALDVLRLLRGTTTTDLAAAMKQLRADQLAGTVTAEALYYLRVLFAVTDGKGVRMAVAATEGLDDPDEIRGSCVALTTDLLELLET